MTDKRNKILHEVKPDWKEIEKKVQVHRKKKARALLVLLICAVAAFAALYIFSQIKTYGAYNVVSSMDRVDTEATTFRQFNGNILKYSNDGAFYTDINNNLIWNQTFEMQEPIVATCEDYVAFADHEGQKVYILNSEGLQGTVETNMAIQTIQVANQGTIAVLMEDDGVGYIALYKTDGECLAEGALHIENSGYPMDMALSNDGEKLAVSILDINEGSVKTTITFYNFGAVGQNKIDNIVSSSSYAGTIVPQLVYISNNKMLAFSDSGVLIFEGNQKPEQTKEVKASAEIKSVVYDDKYFGIVYADEKNESARILHVYDLNGKEVMSAGLDIAYDQIYFLSNHEVCVQNETQAEIFNLHGIKKFQSDFEKKLKFIVKENGIRTYSLLLEGTTDKIRGKILSSTSSDAASNNAESSNTESSNTESSNTENKTSSDTEE